MNDYQRVVHLLGTEHNSKKSAEIIEKVISNENFDCILREGSLIREKSSLNMSYVEVFGKENLIKEPFLFPSFCLYLKYVRKNSADMPTVDKLSALKGLPRFIVDKEFRYIVSDFHKLYNYLIFAGLFCIILGSFLYLLKYFPPTYNSIFSGIVSVISSFAVYDFYFMWRVSQPREIYWTENAADIAERGNFRKILFVCGKLHVKNTERLLSEKGFRIVIV